MTAAADRLPRRSLFTWRAIGFIAFASLLAIWPILLTGWQPFTMIDTLTYMDQGDQIRRVLLDLLPAVEEAEQAGAGAAAPGLGVSAPEAAERSVSIRSIPYSGFLGMVTPLGLAFAAWLQTCIVMIPVYAVAADALARRRAHVVVAAFALLMATPLPFMSSFLMPDAFGAVIVLYAVLLVRGMHRFDIPSQVLLGLVAIFALASHYGNIPLAAALIIVAVLLRAKQKAHFWRSALLGLTAFAVVVLGNMAIGVVAFDETSITPRRYPILLARSIGDGPAYWYLEENCPREQYAVCELWGDDIPRNVGEALWGDRGMTKAEPALYDRIREEEIEILWKSFRAYPLQQVLALAENAFEQMMQVGIAYAEVFEIERAADGPPTGTSLSQQPFLDHYSAISRLHAATYLLGLVYLGYLAVGRRDIGHQRHAIIILFIAMAVNALVFGGLSAPDDRYQARIAWLAPFMAFVFLIERRSKRP